MHRGGEITLLYRDYNSQGAPRRRPSIPRPDRGSLGTSAGRQCGARTLRDSLPFPAAPPTRSPEPEARTRRADHGRKSRRAAKPAVDAAILASGRAGPWQTSGGWCAGAEAAPPLPSPPLPSGGGAEASQLPLPSPRVTPSLPLYLQFLNQPPWQGGSLPSPLLPVALEGG